MTRMNCKLKKPDGSDCGIQIDYDPNTKTAKNVDGTDHFHPKKKNFASGKAMPIEAELEFNASIKGLQERVDKLETAVKALVATIQGRESDG